MKMKLDIKSLSLCEIEKIVLKENMPKFRAEQIFTALHKNTINDLEHITTLKKDTKQWLLENTFLNNIKIAKVQESNDGTRKFQFKTHDGYLIESVFILNASKEGRHALCISSQVGCAMGCTFCATAALKLKRNLTAGEIISQLYEVNNYLAPQNLKVNNIVFMGMGEPLHNVDNVIDAINILCHHKGQNFSPRKITVSTSGIVPALNRLGHETDVLLAISLNASDDTIRSKIMPVNKKWPIEDLINAAKNFPLKTRERITFEYVLLKDINDNSEDAKKVCALLKGLPCKVNLIPFNEHPLSPFKKPSTEKVLAFHKILYKNGICVFTRKTRGDDIDAACGMLGGENLEQRRADIANNSPNIF